MSWGAPPDPQTKERDQETVKLKSENGRVISRQSQVRKTDTDRGQVSEDGLMGGE